MTKYTQKAILYTFETMLREMPFDKITVSALVERCEISSNTFYYHYRDIYDLLDIWMKNKEAKYLSVEDIDDSWKNMLKIFLHDLQENPDLVHHVFNSVPWDRLKNYIFTSLEEHIYRLVRVRAENDEVQLSSEDERVIAGVCCYSLVGFLTKFIWNDMKMDIDKEFDQLCDFLSDSIQNYIQQNGLNKK